MNCRIQYNRLIDRARRRVQPNGYYERHHILPRSLGGGDEPSNLVNLTVKEHLLAHIWLFRIHRDRHPNVIYAVTAFYEDNNPQRIRLRLQRRLTKRLRNDYSVIDSACKAASRIAKGREQAALFNALPLAIRRKRARIAWMDLEDEEE